MATPFSEDANLNPQQVKLCLIAIASSQAITVAKQAVSGQWMLQVAAVDKSFLNPLQGLICTERTNAGKTLSVVAQPVSGIHQLNWT